MRPRTRLETMRLGKDPVMKAIIDALWRPPVDLSKLIPFTVTADKVTIDRDLHVAGMITAEKNIIAHFAGAYAPEIFAALVTESPLYKPTASKIGLKYNAAQLEVNGANELQIKAGVLTPADHGHAMDEVTGLVDALAAKAGLNSPAFTGAPTVPTPESFDNSTRIANTAFVRSVVAALVDSSPASLDTLNELALALGNDPNFATTVLNSLAGKVNAVPGKSLVNDTDIAKLGAFTLIPGLITIDRDLHVSGKITADKNIIAHFAGAYAPEIFANLVTESPLYKPTASKIGLKYNAAQMEVNGLNELQIKAGVLAPMAHSHAIADVTGLQGALDARLNASVYTAADVLAKIRTVDGVGSGLDADMLGGVTMDRFVYGDVNRSYLNWNGGDVNQIYKAGFYALYQSPNAPFVGDGGLVNIPAWIGQDAGSRYNFQIAAKLGNGNFYMRSTGIDGFGTWRELWHSGNLIYPVQGTGTAGYIPKFSVGGVSIENSDIYSDGGDNTIIKRALRVRHIDGKNWNDLSISGDLYLNYNNPMATTLIQPQGGKVVIGTADSTYAGTGYILAVAGSSYFGAGGIFAGDLTSYNNIISAGGYYGKHLTTELNYTNSGYIVGKSGGSNKWIIGSDANITGVSDNNLGLYSYSGNVELFSGSHKTLIVDFYNGSTFNTNLKTEGSLRAVGQSTFGTASDQPFGFVNAKTNIIIGPEYNGSYAYGISTNINGGLDIIANQGDQEIRIYAGGTPATPIQSARFHKGGLLINGEINPLSYKLNGTTIPISLEAGNPVFTTYGGSWSEGLNIDSPNGIWGGIKFRTIGRTSSQGNWHFGYNHLHTGTSGGNHLHLYSGSNNIYVATFQEDGGSVFGGKVAAPSFELKNASGTTIWTVELSGADLLFKNQYGEKEMKLEQGGRLLCRNNIVAHSTQI